MYLVTLTIVGVYVLTCCDIIDLIVSSNGLLSGMYGRFKAVSTPHRLPLTSNYCASNYSKSYIFMLMFMYFVIFCKCKKCTFNALIGSQHNENSFLCIYI